MEETLILNFEVDQSRAEKQLEKIEGLLLDNRKAQQELTKAYKAGSITQEEYVKENIRLQSNIKKEQEQKKVLIRTMETESNSRNSIKQRISALVKEYDNLNRAEATSIKRADALEKELAQLNAQLNKGDKAAGLFKNQIGNYPKQLGDAAKNVNVMGTSVGSLTSQFAGFLNPAGAALGIMSALGTAYANSTVGAKDLEFAQNRLSAAFTIANNSLAEYISSGEDGEGIFSRLVDSFLDSYTPGISALSDLAAKNIELLEDLERKEIEVRGNISDRVEQNQEQLEFIADEQNKINDRLAASDVIEKNLIDNKQEILAVLREQLAALEFQLSLDRFNENLQTLVLQKKREINKESAGAEKQLTRINKTQDDLNAKLTKELELRRKNAEAALELFGFDIREANKPPIDISQPAFDSNNLSGDGDVQGRAPQEIIEDSKKRQDQFISEIKTVELTEKQKRDLYLETAALQKKLSREEVERKRAEADGIFAIGSSLAKGLSALAKEGSEEQKALALAGIAFDTASALAGGISASQDLPYPANLAAMASTIAAVLAAIAEANAVISGYAEGGWTGPGNKHDVAGVVHADEYVVPKSVNNSPAAQPHLAALERMRGGYKDGGFVANTSTAPAQQALIMANAIKNLPTPIVGVTEITRLQTRIQAREKVSTLKP